MDDSHYKKTSDICYREFFFSRIWQETQDLGLGGWASLKQVSTYINTDLEF
jgi:hypothetical protein